MTETQLAFYRSNQAYRSAAAFSDLAAAEAYYRRYLDFVGRHIPPEASLLEVGTGTGTSAVCLSAGGYRTTAIDVCESFFIDGASGRLPRFIAGDAQRLPFATASFDGVTSHQFLEHVANPEEALIEMERVLRPGGWLIVVGPNLISPSVSLLAMFYSLPRTRPLRYWFRAEPGFPTYPFGTTYPELLLTAVRNLWLVARKQIHSQPEFTMREPDFTEPAGADSDSCYLLNPLDLIKHLKLRGFDIVSRRRSGWKLWAPLGGGTWIAARKSLNGSGCEPGSARLTR